MTDFTCYVAGATGEICRVRNVQRAVADMGGTITFDWTAEAETEIVNRFGLPDWSDAPERAEEIADAERQAVIEADVFVLCSPRTAGKGLGCFIEVGMALGWGNTVFLLESWRDSVFWYLPWVHRVEHDEQLSDRLREWLDD